MAPEKLLTWIARGLWDTGVCLFQLTTLIPEHTWEGFTNFKGWGNAVFYPEPTTPIKCGGAPQKIMYLARGVFQKGRGIREKTNVLYATPGKPVLYFGVPDLARTLNKIIPWSRILSSKPFNAPVKIDGGKNRRLRFNISRSPGRVIAP